MEDVQDFYAENYKMLRNSAMEWVELFLWHALKMIFKSIWGDRAKNVKNHSEIGKARRDGWEFLLQGFFIWFGGPVIPWKSNGQFFVRLRGFWGERVRKF